MKQLWFALRHPSQCSGWAKNWHKKSLGIVVCIIGSFIATALHQDWAVYIILFGLLVSLVYPSDHER